MGRPLPLRLAKSVLGDASYAKARKAAYAASSPVRLMRRARRPDSLDYVRKTGAPVSERWGFDRGRPVDRYYIEMFLERHRADVRGACLEVADSAFTDRYGGGVTGSDVLDIKPDNPNATIIGDLRRLDGVADATFDCVILTQVLQYIDDLDAAVRELHRILKPGGVLLLTVPSLSRLQTLEGDFWRFTPASVSYLLGKAFDPVSVTVERFGSVVTGLAFWIGMAREELTSAELDQHDDLFPCIVGARVLKR
jgi:SAM-dependent methyltransferase